MTTPVFTDTILYTVNNVSYPRFEEALAASQSLSLPVTITASGSLVISDATSNTTPPANTTPDPPVANVSSNVVASVHVVCSNQTVTFTDQSVSALPLTSVTVGYGLGGTAKEIGAGGSATKDYPNPGTFNAALVSTDSSGVKSTVLFRVTVPGTSDNVYTAGAPTSPPTGNTSSNTSSNTGGTSGSPPVASFKITQDGLTVTLTDTSTDKDADIVDVAVNWGDGALDPDIGKGAVVSHTYAQNGSYTILESVADSTGNTSKVSKDVYAVPANTPATADFDVVVNGLDIVVTDKSQRGSVPLATAVWQWGDFPGSSPTVPPGGTMRHGFDVAGTYPVMMRISDASGSGAAVTKQVTVSGVRAAPLNIPSPDSVTVVWTPVGGTPITINPKLGECVPFVAGDPTKGGAKYYADGLCVTLENMYAGTTGDLSGHFTITAAGVTVFDGDLTLYVGAGSRPFWLRTPTLVTDPDLSLFPELVDAPTASMWNSYHAADNSPTGYGCDISAMGTAGEHAHLGQPYPQWDACHRTNPSDQNTEVVLGMANASRVWSSHWRDITTGQMIDVTQYPKISTLSAFRGIQGNPIAPYTTSNPTQLGQAQAHATNFCAYAAVVFGTEYHKEELAMWSNYYSALWQNYAYRLPAGCVSVQHGIVRGKGRGLTALVYAAKYSSNPAYFDKWVLAIAADYNAFYPAQQGFAIDQTAKGQGYPHQEYAPWQQQILITGIGLAMLAGYSEFQPTLDYFATVAFDAILSDGAQPVLQHEFATVYNSGLIRADGSGPVSDWRESINLAGTYDAAVAAALLCPEDSAALQSAKGGGQPGNFIGSPTSPVGYPAIARPSYALLFRFATDQVRAQAAGQKFEQYDVADYSTNPKYGYKFITK